MRDQSSQKNQVVVLLSGGVDSSACVAFFIERGFDVEALFVDYGQLATEQERIAAASVAQHYGVRFREMRCVGATAKSTGAISARNAFLIFAALMETPASLLALGVHAGTNYWDCSADFVEKIQEIIDEYENGCVRVAVPFLSWTKRQIWEFCRAKGVPLQLTYSCEAGGSVPCGLCLSCRDVEALRAGEKLNNQA